MVVPKRVSRTYFLIVAIIATCTVWLFLPRTAKAECAGVNTVILQCSSESSTNGAWELLLLVVNILTVGVGIVAVGGIAYGALLWSTAGGETARVQKAKETIRNTIIGLILFVGLYSIAGFFIPGGAFNQPQIPIARDGNGGGGGKDGNSDTKKKKATVRIGNYNAASVTYKNNAQTQRNKFKIGWPKIQGQADVVIITEFSIAQYDYLSGLKNWNVYYPTGARGDRGNGIAYRSDLFTASDKGSIAIPVISTSNRLTKQYEPFLTLTRKSDGARLTVLAVHLAAINGSSERWQKNQKAQQPIIGKWLAKGTGNQARVAAGDFNWYLPGHMNNLTTIQMKLKGERSMRMMIPSDQQFGDYYKSIAPGGATDHNLLVVEVVTKWFK